jgi:7-cyano-7-deazaguanine synthase
MSTLVLFSGGMDSTIALFHALNMVSTRRGLVKPVHTITFNYGQRHEREISAAKKVLEIASLRYEAGFTGQSIFLDIRGSLPPVGSLLGEVPVKHYEKETNDLEPDPSFIPHRNLIFLSFAASWARRLQAHYIMTGLRGGFPDCTIQFEDSLVQTLSVSDPGWDLQVWSPVHMSRENSLRLANSIPGCMEALAYSLTCFEGREPPCGVCLPCTKRAEGFQAIGIPDPLLQRCNIAQGE